MDVSGVGAAASAQVPQRSTPPVDVQPATGGAPAAGEATSSLGASSATQISSTSSSLSLRSTSTSSSRDVSGLITAATPFIADQELLKAILMLIVLQQLLDESSNQTPTGLHLLSGGSAQSSFQSLEITQSEQSVTYAQSAYQQTQQGSAIESPQGSAVDPSAEGGEGTKLDLQA